MILNKKSLLSILGVLTIVTVSSQSFAVEAEGTNAPQSVAATGQTCDADAFYNSLGLSESGGCGGGNQYNCTGPVITSGMHAGDRPLGKYQFMPKTLQELGIPVAGFVGNAAAQEEAIRRFTSRNNDCLNSSYTVNGVTYPPASSAIGTVVNGVTITRSGLLGASHLSGCGGARRMIRTQSAGSSDQLGTSALAYAGKFEGYGMFGDVAGGTCGEGVPNAAYLFSEAQVGGLHDLIGCDPAVYDVAETMINAQLERENELIKEFITKPTPVEQSTCLDQYTSLVSAAGGVHSNPGGNIDSSIIPIVQQPLENTLTNIASSIFDPLNAVINNQFADIFNGFGGLADSFNGLFGGGGGSVNVPNVNCDMQQAVWDAAQCIEIPQLSSLSDIISDRLDVLSGRVDSAPETFLQAACGRINDGLQNSLGSLFNNVTDTYDNAARVISQPLSDAASDLP